MKTEPFHFNCCARFASTLGILLAALTLHAAPHLRVEEPEGTEQVRGTKIFFGHMASSFVAPSSTGQAPNGTVTVVFNVAPDGNVNLYQIQKSFTDHGPWFALFVPGLQPDSSGMIVYQEPAGPNPAFYRLFVTADLRRVFTLKNTGTTALTGIGVAVGGAQSGFFDLDLTTMNTTLAPGDSTSFSVTYNASDTVTRKATLRITGNIPAAYVATLIGGDVPPPPQLYAVLLRGTGDTNRARAEDVAKFKQALLRFDGVEATNMWETSTVLGAYNAMAAIGSKIKPDDTLLFFYVGHGDWNTESNTEPAMPTSVYVQKKAKKGVTLNLGDEYLAVNSKDMFRSDGTPNPAADFITDNELTILFQAVPNTDQVRKLAVLSACFSGGFWVGTNGHGSDTGDLDRVPNTALFASAQEGDTGLSDDLRGGDGRSLFVKSLEVALKDMADHGLSLSFNNLQAGLVRFYNMEQFDPSHTQDFFVDGPWFDTPMPATFDEVGLSAFSAATADFDTNASLTGTLPPVYLLPPQLTVGNLLLSWQTVSNLSYTVQASLDLNPTNWFDVTNFFGDGQITSVAVPASGDVPQQFFRVVQP